MFIGIDEHGIGFSSILGGLIKIIDPDKIRQLNKNWKYNGIVKVIGKQFEERDIDSVYFRSVSFTSVEGYQDTVQFSINASSIKAVNFTLLKPNS